MYFFRSYALGSCVLIANCVVYVFLSRFIVFICSDFRVRYPTNPTSLPGFVDQTFNVNFTITQIHLFKVDRFKILIQFVLVFQSHVYRNEHASIL